MKTGFGLSEGAQARTGVSSHSLVTMSLGLGIYTSALLSGCGTLGESPQSATSPSTSEQASSTAQTSSQMHASSEDVEAPSKHVLAYCEARALTPSVVAPPTVHHTPRSSETLTSNLGAQDGAAVWTGEEVLLWGGDHITSNRCPGTASNARDVGARYHRASGVWSDMSKTGAPTGRHVGASLWTGTEMVVWGGYDGLTQTLNDGARYNPTTDSWRAMNTTGAPTNSCPQTVGASQDSIVFWFGSEGYAYALNTDTWQALPNPPQKFEPDTASAWSGRELFVIDDADFGSESCELRAAALDPLTGDWRAISSPPECLSFASAFWSGQYLLLWGYEGAAVYSPCDDEWQTLPNAKPPVDADAQDLTWIGQQLLAQLSVEVPGSDALASEFYRYVPTEDTWFEIEPLEFGTGVWTGSELIALHH